MPRNKFQMAKAHKSALISVLSTIAIILQGCKHTADYDATGTFEATDITISAETTGKIMMLDISEGDSVTAGQKLAVIDTCVLALQHSQPAAGGTFLRPRHLRPGGLATFADRSPAA